MYAADARFVSLAELLAPAPVAATVDARPDMTEPPVDEAPVVCAPETYAAIRAARVFGASLADAFDALLIRLVRDLSAEVLARELQLRPADVSAIAQRLLRERAHDGPLRVRVASADAGIACDLPVIVDAALQAGDAVLECGSGSIDARLGVRLADVVSALTR